jgi:predicted transcriptional regulator
LLSTASVLLKLFEAKSIDAEELKELRRLIDRKLKGQ